MSKDFLRTSLRNIRFQKTIKKQENILTKSKTSLFQSTVLMCFLMLMASFIYLNVRQKTTSASSENHSEQLHNAVTSIFIVHWNDVPRLIITALGTGNYSPCVVYSGAVHMITAASIQMIRPLLS